MPGITKTAIVNMTLGELGAALITNIETDTSKTSGIVRLFWDFALDWALALHPWNFAVTRVANVAETTAPAWKYQHAYPFPTNCLRVMGLGQGGTELDVPWEVELDNTSEQRVIVTDLDAPVDIKFIKRVLNTELYSPTFCVALSKTLKIFLARPLTGKPEIKVEAENELRMFLQAAQTTDGLEGTPQFYAPTDLEDVR